MLPWRENARLLKALYEKVQGLEDEFSQLKEEYEKLALVNQLKSEISTKVFLELKEHLSESLAKSIMEAINLRLNSRGQGVV